jgi:uncharacterized protein (TIGR00255 family)
MAPSSMTGFARNSFIMDGTKYSWELKSVNARGLEVRMRLPPGLDHLETEARIVARETLGRGSCVFTLFKEGEEEGPRLVLDEAALALVIAAARRLASVEGIAMPTADGILAIPGVLRERQEVGAEAAERRDAAALEAFRAGVAALKAARAEEGERLETVLDRQLDTFDRLIAAAEEVAAETPDLLKARIREQVALLTASPSSLDPDRLHQEAVLAATRADVREELDRLKSHVAGARQLIQSGDAVGRRLEFLSQEFNREANTLCSKSADRRLTAIGVELKSAIDQFREQVQNLE